MINTHPNRILTSPQAIFTTDKVRQHIFIISLLIAVFLSSLALVYVNDMHRQMVMKRALLASSTVDIHDHWGQLLKKQSQLNNEMAIANKATQQLAMTKPDRHHIVTLRLTHNAMTAE